MKKLVFIVAVSLLYAANASAIGPGNPVGTTDTDATVTTTLSVLKGFNPTKNVNLHFKENAASNNVTTTWASVSAHAQGDKEFVTSSAFGGIAFKVVTPGATNGTTAPTAPATPTDSSVPGSGYTKM